MTYNLNKTNNILKEQLINNNKSFNLKSEEPFSNKNAYLTYNHGHSHGYDHNKKINSEYSPSRKRKSNL